MSLLMVRESTEDVPSKLHKKVYNREENRFDLYRTKREPFVDKEDPIPQGL